MSFLNPTGLWLLLGIPVLIIIYLIKAQHEDRPVSSTYIWKLSSRFMKKKLPMQKLKKILMFLLQLLIIIAVSLLAARPAVVNGKSCDYIAIIDASASMQTSDETGTTRFDYALEQVAELATEIENGHSVSIILAADTASWLVQQSTSQNNVKLALNNAKCTYGSCNSAQAIELAQLLCQRSRNAQVLFFTDNNYSETKNVQVTNLNQNEWNVSVSSITANKVAKGISFTGSLISYNRDATVTVGLRIDGQLMDAQIIDCTQDTSTSITFTVEDVSSYDTAEIFIETSDALQADNRYAICRKSDRTYSVLLVSESPLYLESALNALGSCEVTVVSSLEEAELSDHDLYIFDGISPESYPEDGSVVIFGTQQLPDGLSAGAIVETSAELSMDTQTASDLYEGLSLSDTAVTNYCPLSGNTLWNNLFFCEDAAVVSTREMGNGLHATVVSFDLHDSNLPMQTDFVVFMRNLVEYSVPAFLKDTDHTAGGTVALTVMPAAQQLYVELPDDSIRSLSTASSTASVAVDEVGIYTAVMTTADGGEYVDFFVHIPDGETASDTVSELSVELSSDTNLQAEDATSEIWFWLALGMLLIVLTEWGWYYREQY